MKNKWWVLLAHDQNLQSKCPAEISKQTHLVAFLRNIDLFFSFLCKTVCCLGGLKSRLIETAQIYLHFGFGGNLCCCLCLDALGSCLAKRVPSVSLKHEPEERSCLETVGRGKLGLWIQWADEVCPGNNHVLILTAQRLICWEITSIMWWLLFETVLFLSESVLKCSCSPSSCLILCTGSSLVVATQRRYTEDGLALVGLLSDSFQLSPPQGCVGSQSPSLPLSLLPQIWNLCSGLRHCPWLFPEAAAPSPNKGELAGILELKQTSTQKQLRGERLKAIGATWGVFSGWESASKRKSLWPERAQCLRAQTALVGVLGSVPSSAHMSAHSHV